FVLKSGILLEPYFDSPSIKTHTHEDTCLSVIRAMREGRPTSGIRRRLMFAIYGETFTHDITLRSVRLPTALAGIDLGQYDAMVLDTQGSELLILQSAATILGGFNFMQVEAANFEPYRGCATVDEVNTFLRSHGFRLLHKDLQARRAAGGEY